MRWSPSVLAKQWEVVSGALYSTVVTRLCHAMSDLRMAKAVSLTGSKIEYIPNKYASTTSAILVLDYDIVAKQNRVKSLGKPVQYRDVVRLLEEYPSAHVTACPADDALLVEYTSETANRKCRKAAVDAVEKVQRDSGPQDEIEDVDPPPRRRRSSRPSHGPSGLACCVCLSENVDFVALTPCFHTSFCTTCSTEMMRRNVNCPICRTHVTGTQRVFFA